jgi:hypothetical protein
MDLFNQIPRFEDVLESGDMAPQFLTSAPDGDEWSASRLAALLLRKELQVPNGGGWMGPQSLSGLHEEGNIFTSTANGTSNSQVVQRIA